MTSLKTKPEYKKKGEWDEKREFSFQSILPISEEIRKKTINEQKKFHPHVMSDEQWNWCEENWGTKWDVSAGQMKLIDGSEWDENLLGVTYEFETPWAPPQNVIEKIATKHNELQFYIQYIEIEDNYRAYQIYKNGKLTARFFVESEDYWNFFEMKNCFRTEQIINR